MDLWWVCSTESPVNPNEIMEFPDLEEPKWKHATAANKIYDRF